MSIMKILKDIILYFNKPNQISCNESVFLNMVFAENN